MVLVLGLIVDTTVLLPPWWRRGQSADARADGIPVQDPLRSGWKGAREDGTQLKSNLSFFVGPQSAFDADAKTLRHRPTYFATGEIHL